MTSARVAGFRNEHGDCRVEGFQALEGGGSRFTVRGVEVRLSMAGRHQALNATAAIAAGDFAGVSVEAAANALAAVSVELRLQEMINAGRYSHSDESDTACPAAMVPYSH